MILALGQNWMVMCAILSVAMCLADILILTLPNTLAYVMDGERGCSHLPYT
jgi:hypothetical protein